MGRIAESLSDRVYVTSDNPRTEDPAAIIAEILAGFRNPAVPAIADRKLAIEEALGIARPGDVVLVAGKGHETYQIIGTERNHFDDREVIRAFFARNAGGTVE
jgi:UDP-N-acetylmuramoyl-L-alanyl-D-glutamate--2,6-diaminopimelate ligase